MELLLFFMLLYLCYLFFLNFKNKLATGLK